MIRVILGILLTVGAFYLLLSFIQGSPTVNTLLTGLVCKPGEQFSQEIGDTVANDFGRNRGQELAYYCINQVGGRRDVTEGVIFVAIGGFVIPLLMGIGLVIASIVGMVRGSQQRAAAAVVGNPASFGGFTNQPKTPSATAYEFDFSQPGQSATVITMNGQQVSPSDLPADTAQLVNQVLDNMGAMIGDAKVWTMTTAGSLTEKLQQLQDAKDKGLISQEEFDRLRQEILDGMN
jgi:hypothetical protein